MSAPLKVYLAGPEVFLRDAAAIGRQKRALCERRGAVGLFPLDGGVARLGPDEPPHLAIYRANLALIREADAGIANLTPFRGPSADPGTVLEVGLMAGLGKPVFGYTNAERSLLDCMRGASQAFRDDATATWRDGLDMEIEDFGHADNLMIDGCLRQAGRPIVAPEVAPADLFRDLTGFERCLDMALAELRPAMLPFHQAAGLAGSHGFPPPQAGEDP